MPCSNLDDADVFFGNEEVNLPTPQGIAAAWNWLKAIAGNTHPGATRPMGMVSVCPFSGAYPSGYGLNEPNWEEIVPKRFDRYTATGITHFHQTGTGEIGIFYNFLRVAPTLGDFAARDNRHDLVAIEASPGHYAATLDPAGIRVELTTAGKCALHRYTFPVGAAKQFCLHMGRAGLGDEYRAKYASVIETEITDARSGHGHIVVAGFSLYFAYAIDRAATARFWIDGEPLEARQLSLPANAQTPCPRDVGIVIDAPADADPVIEFRISFSLRSTAQARQALQDQMATKFDRAREDAADAWRALLARIDVTGGPASARGMFYSCLYHSFVKPIDASGESPYRDGDAPYFLDFATLWDQYKTQSPLIALLYPRTAERIIQAWLDVMDAIGYPTNMLLMSPIFEDGLDQQAQHLVYHTIADAFIRKFDGIDWERALAIMDRCYTSVQARVFARDGWLIPNVQTLDLATAAGITAHLADALGHPEVAARMRPLAANWRNAYDPQTGLLKDVSVYYEGTFWTYSFRLLPNMSERIAIHPDTAAFVATLDRFFGYDDIADGSVSPHPVEPFIRKARHHRFEGLNNEPDMETPYAYIFAGRHDRACEVLRAVMRWQFAPGKGGLPGNNDSGALSSWFVWSAMGIFPVTGQDLYLIGSPLFESATTHLDRADFRVEARDNSDTNIYVTAAWLNGQPLDRAWLRVSEVESGGQLVLQMGPTPNGWASTSLPPDGP